MKFSRERFQNGSLRRVPRKTGPDVWEFRFRDHSKPGLPMRQITLSTVEYQTETAARRALQALLLKINGSEAYIAQRSPTFGTVLDKFITDEHLKEIKAQRPGETVEDGLKFSTTVGYLSVIKVHLRPSWSKVLLTDIKPLAVQEWLKQLNLSPKTKQNIKAAFHRMLELAMLWELLPAQRNPLSLVEIKGGTRRKRKKVILTPEQFQQLCTLLEEPYLTMIIIAMCLGLRVSEILALKWTDFDFEAGTLMITRGTVHGRIGRVKTEYSEDEMPLDPAFAKILLKWKGLCPASEQGWVFPNPNTGGVWHSSVLQGDILVPAGKKIGIDRLGWHMFRHSYRSMLDACGAPIGVQQKLMRHAQMSTTMQYGNAYMTEKRKAHGAVVQMVLPAKPAATAEITSVSA
ncbi:MAG: tyrosine-type recombinase/integrase [Acidobacteriaceae bacterium]